MNLFVRVIGGCVLLTLALTGAGCAPSPSPAPAATPTSAPTAAQPPGSSPLTPAPLGVQVEAPVACVAAEGAAGRCDAELTVLEVVRGEKAWELIKAASESNKAPNAGYEYVLVRIGFELSTRTPGSKSFEITTGPLGMFTAYSADGKKYETPSVELPKPALSGVIHSEESLEGWIAFQVPQGESKLLAAFESSYGQGRTGTTLWFQLY